MRERNKKIQLNNQENNKMPNIMGSENRKSRILTLDQVLKPKEEIEADRIKEQERKKREEQQDPQQDTTPPESEPDTEEPKIITANDYWTIKGVNYRNKTIEVRLLKSLLDFLAKQDYPYFLIIGTTA